MTGRTAGGWIGKSGKGDGEEVAREMGDGVVEMFGGGDNVVVENVVGGRMMLWGGGGNVML